MVANFTRTDSLKMALANGLNGDLEPCVRDGCVRSYTTPRDAILATRAHTSGCAR
jgi:hypothetical protein